MNKSNNYLKPSFIVPQRIQPQLPLFIYLPGMDGSGELLRSQTARLENSFDVRCLKIPANDLSDWDNLTKYVVDAIKQEIEGHIGRSTYLCGESFGGCLAMKVATQIPHLLKRIILVNPASSFHRLPLLSWASGLLNFVPSPFYSLSTVGFLPFLMSLGKISDKTRQEVEKTIREIPSKTINWRVSLLREWSINNNQLSQLHQPVLLLASDSDRLLPSAIEAEILKEILPNARIVVLPDSGHACLLENDINLYEIMKNNDFIEK
ncbi:MAG: alpha/beta fold hydrolase [Mastigocoleus sp.]